MKDKLKKRLSSAEVASMAEAALQRPDLSDPDRVQIKRILAEARHHMPLPGETA